MKHLLFFCLKSTATSTLTYLIILAGSHWAPAYFLYDYQLLIVVYFFITSLIGHSTIALLGTKAERFTLVYMAVSTIKLLLSFSIVAVIATKQKDTALFFAINFLTSYLIFTVFEINEFVKFLKQEK